MSDDFDNMDDFDSIELPKDTDSNNSSNNGNNYNNDNNGGYKPYNKGGNNSYNNKPKVKRNLIGTSDINLWDKPKIDGKELDVNKFKTDKKFFSFALPSPTYKMTDDDKKVIIKMLEMLEKKGYSIRFVCTHVRAIYDDIKAIFGLDRMIHITLWASYCKDSAEDLPLHIASDTSIQLGVTYVKNYHNLPPSVQYIYAGVITSLFGQDGDEPSSFFITWDPYKVDKMKVDFSKSKDTSNYYLVSKPFSLDVYNLTNTADRADLEQILL